MRLSLIRPFALLFAGALISTAVNLIIQCGTDCLLIIIILFVFFFFFSLIGMKFDSLFLYCYRLKLRDRKTRIGILNDMEWQEGDHQIAAHTDISPKEWEEAIVNYSNENDIEIKMIRITDDFTPFKVVLNPYGGVYPEEELRRYTTLDKIFDYVNNGGRFVNVSDIPGYWAYSPLLKRRIESTPPFWQYLPSRQGIYNLKSTRPFPDVPWMQRLGLLIYSIGSDNGVEMQLKVGEDFKNIIGEEPHELRIARVAKKEPNMDIAHWGLVDGLDGNSMAATSLFFVKYGEGDFLMSLAWTEQQDTHVKQAFKRIIISLAISAPH